jgi:hypothetical protein
VDDIVGMAEVEVYSWNGFSFPFLRKAEKIRGRPKNFFEFKIIARSEQGVRERVQRVFSKLFSHGEQSAPCSLPLESSASPNRRFLSAVRQKSSMSSEI